MRDQHCKTTTAIWYLKDENVQMLLLKDAVRCDGRWLLEALIVFYCCCLLPFLFQACVERLRCGCCGCRCNVVRHIITFTLRLWCLEEFPVLFVRSSLLEVKKRSHSSLEMSLTSTQGDPVVFDKVKGAYAWDVRILCFAWWRRWWWGMPNDEMMMIETMIMTMKIKWRC